MEHKVIYSDFARLARHWCAAGMLLIGSCIENPASVEPAMSMIDATLCELISGPLVDTLVTIDTTGATPDTTVAIFDIHHSAATRRVSDLDSLWYQADDTTIASFYATVMADTALRLSVSGADTSYAVAMVPGGSGMLILAFDHYPMVELLDPAGGTHKPIDSTIPLGTVAECYDGIQTRLVFDVSQGNYLLRLIRTESFRSPALRMALVRSANE